MLSTGQLVKESLLIGTLNIGLPTADVGSDGVLIYKLYRGVPYHPNCPYYAGTLWVSIQFICIYPSL